VHIAAVGEILIEILRSSIFVFMVESVAECCSKNIHKHFVEYVVEYIVEYVDKNVVEYVVKHVFYYVVECVFE